MLKIHHLNQSRSERIVWLAEELGLDYELVKHQRDPNTMRSPPSLWAVSPMGKSPVIEDGSAVVFESGAVVEYLLDRYGNGRLRPPTGTPEYLRYQHWLHCAESTLAVPVIVSLLTRALEKTAAIDGFLQNEYKTAFAYLDRQLGANGYVAGADFSAADIMVAYMLWILDGSAVPKLGFSLPSPLPEYANIVGYLARLRQRPAHLRALERMGD